MDLSLFPDSFNYFGCFCKQGREYFFTVSDKFAQVEYFYKQENVEESGFLVGDIGVDWCKISDLLLLDHVVDYHWRISGNAGVD